MSLRTHLTTIICAIILTCATQSNALPLAYSDARTSENERPVVKTGSGVYYATGTYFFGENDLRISARSIPMTWERNYRSNRVISDTKGQWNFAAPADSSMGFGWHNIWLCRIENDSFKNEVGHYTSFGKDANGTYLPNLGAGLTLRKTVTGYELIETGGKTYTFDSTGKLLTLRDSAGNSATLQYDGDNLIGITDVMNRQIFRFTYNAEGHIATITDLANRVVTYDYDINGNLTQVKHGTDITATYSYNANHGITTKTDATGSSYTILYYPKWEDKGVVQKITNPGGQSSSFIYDFASRIYYTTDYSGVTNRHVLTSSGSIQQSDKIGADGQATPRIKIEYLDNRITKTTDALGNVTSEQKDDRGNTIKRTDADGNEWRYQYDANSRQTTVIDPLGTITRYEYDANGNRTKETLAAGTADESISTFTYNSYREQLTSSSNGAVTTYVYDIAGNLTGITDPENNTTTMIYDAAGNLSSRTIPLIGTTAYANHDWNGNPRTITDPNGTLTTSSYDIIGRILTSTTDTATTTYGYTPTGGVCTSCSGTSADTGKIAYIIQPEGNRIDYGYDPNGNLATITDNDGNKIVFSYDSNGNKIKEEIKDGTGSLHKTVSYQYDILRRLIKTINPDQGETTYMYDRRGNCISIINPNSSITTFYYDQINRHIRGVQSGGAVTNYSYNLKNKIISVTDANQNATRYEYDSQGKLVRSINPDTGIINYTYDKNRNIKSKTDATGTTISYSYDAVNRLTLISFPNPSDNISYTYDACLNGKGRLCILTDPSGSTRYEYSKKGQITKETSTIGTNAFTTEYGYDRNGNVTSMKYPSGRIISYSYANDKVTSILNNGTAIATNIVYKPFGGLSALTFGNGIIQTNIYDQQYRLTTITAGTIQNLGYTYDKNGNITMISDTLNSTNTKVYGYDQLDRLINAQGPWGQLGFSYDKVGNRMTENHNDTITSYDYKPNSNQLTSMLGERNYGFGYDQNGNMQTENNRTYIYNQNQRLIKVTEQTTTKDEQGQDVTTITTNGEYFYNGKGQRVRKVIGNQMSYFVFDQQEKMIQELGASVAEYVFLNGSPYAKIENTAIYYIHTDHLSTPQKMTDSQKQLVWEIQTMPFGETFSINGTAANNLRFPGQHYDDETGMNYNYFRDYKSYLGRYIQADPIGLAGGLNLYSYVQQNSVNSSDPKGLLGPWPGWTDFIPWGPQCNPTYNKTYVGSEIVSTEAFDPKLKTQLPNCDCSQIGLTVNVESITGYKSKSLDCTSTSAITGDVVTLVTGKYALISKKPFVCAVLSKDRCKNNTCGWLSLGNGFKDEVLIEKITEKYYFGVGPT